MAVTQFRDFLQKRSLDIKVIESDSSTHTAQQAADVHSVPVSNIVKSLLCTDGEVFYMILTPGDKRLDLEMWAKNLGLSNFRMANPDEVKKMTGYSIGGVPPFGHLNAMKIYIENGFNPEEKLVAAAGSSNAVFEISFTDLNEIVNLLNSEVDHEQ